MLYLLNVFCFYYNYFLAAINFLKKLFLQYIRIKNKPNKMNIKDILEHSSKFNELHSAFKCKRKVVNKTLTNEIYRNILKRKQNKINKELKKLKFNKLANTDAKLERDLTNIKKYSAYPLKNLQQIAKLRNIDSNMQKKDIIHALIRSEPAINEEKYISYLNNDSNNDIHNELNKINMQLFEVSQYISKKALKDIKNRLRAIKKLTKITTSEKNKILKELSSISTDLKFKRKNMISDYRDDNYANIDDLDLVPF